MALVVLITAILISALVVKVGTVALTMTGMDRRKAAFQSQSDGANTGWTTRETELIMAHDQRRRIVGAVMARPSCVELVVRQSLRIGFSI